MSTALKKALNRFPSGLQSREITLTLVALHQRFEAIRRAELTRLQPKLSALSPAAKTRLDEITRLIVEKLLLTPTEQLTSVSDGTLGVRYADMLNRLFRLSIDGAVGWEIWSMSYRSAETLPPEWPSKICSMSSAESMTSRSSVRS